MSKGSFYEATGRESVSASDISASQASYTYNYRHLLPASQQARILDLGCSEGISMEWLSQQGFSNIVGVDSDAVAIKRARERLNGILSEDRFVCDDAMSYLQSCDDGSLDMVVMFNVIEHIPREVILDMMSEINRVLSSNGSFLAQTGNWENPFNIGLFTRDFTHHVMYTKNSLRQLMILSGFSKSQISVQPLRYRLTPRNAPLFVLSPLCGWLVKMFALCMRMRIRETAAIIFCSVKK